MSSAQSSALAREWKARLGLTHRRLPELYESVDLVVDVPHASTIRAALDDMGLSAVFCVQGTPTVAILETNRYDLPRDKVATGRATKK